MPGTDEEVTITIGEKTWKLTPPAGMAAFKMMPKVLRILSEWVWGAVHAGIPLDKMFLEGAEFQVSSLNVLKAIGFVSEKIVDQWDELSSEVIPFLLQCKPGFLEKNGQPREILTALWTSLKFYAPFVFGVEVEEALKKSVTADPVVGEDEFPKTDSK